jgi:hypothetical protein
MEICAGSASLREDKCFEFRVSRIEFKKQKIIRVIRVICCSSLLLGWVTKKINIIYCFSMLSFLLCILCCRNLAGGHQNNTLTYDLKFLMIYIPKRGV